MMLSPIFAILYGPTNMIALITLSELSISAQLLPGAMAHVQWRFVSPMALVAVICMPLGILILVSVDPVILTRVIAAIVGVFALSMVWGWRYKGEKKLSITVGVGALSGTMMATTSMGGPPVLAYMLSGPDHAATNRANIIVYYAFTGLGVLGLMFWHGFLEWWHVGLAIIITPIYVIGGAIGSRGFRASSEQLYRRVALGILLVVALFGLLR